MALGHWAVEYLGEGNGQGGSGGGGGLVVHMVGDDPTRPNLDKTWQEIHDALVAGRYVLVSEQYENEVTQKQITTVGIDGADYCVYVGSLTFKADSADGYPSANNK